MSSAETLVERLRNPAWSHGGGLPSVLDTDSTLADLREAAAEIEALRAARDDALAALEPFAKCFDVMSAKPDDKIMWGYNDVDLTYGDFRRARALQPHPGTGESDG